MALVDEVILHISAGSGGDGVVQWHRNRRIQKGGPAGGDGGRGGDVYLRGVRDVERLAKYISNPKFKAEDGGPGGSNSLEGKDGEDLFIDIPLGSLVTFLQSKETPRETYDIVKEGQLVKILSGGKGGFGNEHFKSSRNVTPMEQTDGKLGEVGDFKVELRLIADAGFIGYPNAGKSTLLNALTNSKAKIGNYAFTTLEPNLGAFGHYILADIPGLIEGASSGKGLGDRFLKHVMRTKTLIHCISAERDNIKEAYDAIRKELKEYDSRLLDKKEILVITKSDMVDDETLEELIKDASEIYKETIAVSVIDDDSIEQLGKEIMNILHKEEAES
jgi:GTP-binding protein